MRNAIKRVTTLALTLTILLGSSVINGNEVKAAEANPYGDVKGSDWYYDSTIWNYNEGYMTGKSAGQFKPNDKLTRSEFATIIYRYEFKFDAKEADADKKFPDVGYTTAGHEWYIDAVNWAASSSVSVVKGYDTGKHAGKFGTSDNITREQLATMLYRYAQYRTTYENWNGFIYKPNTVDTEINGDLNVFKDGGKVSTFAKDAVAWAVGKKIIEGKYNGTQIDPQGHATRAEISAMIQRYDLYVSDAKRGLDWGASIPFPE